MAFSKVTKAADATTKVAKPASASKGVFGTGKFGQAKYGKSGTTWSSTAKAADATTKVAKP